MIRLRDCTCSPCTACRHHRTWACCHICRTGRYRWCRGCRRGCTKSHPSWPYWNSLGRGRTCRRCTACRRCNSSTHRRTCQRRTCRLRYRRRCRRRSRWMFCGCISRFWDRSSHPCTGRCRCSPWTWRPDRLPGCTNHSPCRDSRHCTANPSGRPRGGNPSLCRRSRGYRDWGPSNRWAFHRCTHPHCIPHPLCRRCHQNSSTSR